MAVGMKSVLREGGGDGQLKRTESPGALSIVLPGSGGLTCTPEAVYHQTLMPCVVLNRCLLVVLLSLGALAPARMASAQYKNSAFALDLAGTYITRPGVLDGSGNQLSNSSLPNRLAYGERLGAEVNFKLNEDHWWFIGHLNLGLFGFATWGSDNTSRNYQFDQAAKTYIGTELGIQAVPGVRYYFFTDRKRPYLQLGFSYMRLFTFSSTAGDPCSLPLCPSGGAFADVFLPHPNVLALHLQPGVEFVLKRDLALHMALDIQRWLIINAPGNFSFNVVLGVTFYS